MLGAVIGDVIGSVFEFRNVKTTDFPLFCERSTFTDDTVLTVAVARAILTGEGYAESLRDFGKRYPDAGYGGMFKRWLKAAEPRPYESWGNGSAMRVSPVGLAFDTTEKVLAEARKTAEVTHNHPDGIKGAQATALAVFMARTGTEKDDIKKEITGRFEYDLARPLDEIRPSYKFDSSCAGSVPQALTAFLESEDFEDAVRKAVSLGGDSDTIASIAGAVAQAFYKEVPEEIASNVRERLPEEFLEILDGFSDKYGVDC